MSFLVGFIKDIGFRKIILKCDNEPSTKAFQDAVIHACAGEEVIPQGPHESDHMANGRVEMAVREVKRKGSSYFRIISGDYRVLLSREHNSISRCTRRQSESKQRTS